MSLSKSLSSFILAISMSSLSLYAHATLTIVNNTNQDSTAVINGTCSSMSLLGEYGITRAHSSNTINNFVIWAACHNNPTDCVADVYMTTVCGTNGANKVATIVFDTTGVKPIEIAMYSGEYQFTHSDGTGSDFEIRLDGGPAHLT